MANGPIPEGLCVCHTCDNRPCCNISHFFLGTRTENLEDMTAKGRRVKGESHGCAKLTEEDVLAIRTDNRTLEVIAKQYGVSYALISYVRNGKIWKHVS
jgi:hypothetical protein